LKKCAFGVWFLYNLVSVSDFETERENESMRLFEELHELKNKREAQSTCRKQCCPI